MGERNDPWSLLKWHGVCSPDMQYPLKVGCEGDCTPPSLLWQLCVAPNVPPVHKGSHAGWYALFIQAGGIEAQILACKHSSFGQCLSFTQEASKLRC